MVSIHRFAILSNKASSNSNNNNNGSLGSINEIAHTRCSCFETNRPKLTDSTARPTLSHAPLSLSLFLSLSCANNINLATMRRSHDRAKAAVAVVLWIASPRAIVVGTVSTYRAAPLRRRHATHYHNHASVRCPLYAACRPPNVQGHGLCGACPPFACAQVRITAREGVWGMGQLSDIDYSMGN